MNSELDLQDISCRYGTLRVLRQDLPIAEALRAYGEWAQLEVDFLRGLTRQGDIVLDIGAHVGTHTLALADAVGPSGKVLAFEPQAIMFGLLSHNVMANSRSNVVAYQAVVSAGSGFWRPESVDYSTRGNFGAVRMKQAGADEENVVESLSIDSLGLETCALTKVDVEGAEMQVLEGMSETIRRCRPILYLEALRLEPAWRMVEWLKERHYDLFHHATPSFNSFNYRGNPINIFGAAHEAALLAVPQERKAALQLLLDSQAGLRSCDGLEGLALAWAATPRYGDPDALGVPSVTLARQLQDQQRRLQVLEEKLEREAELLVQSKEAEHSSQARAVALDARVLALESSWSWKIVAPLRWLVGAAARVRRDKKGNDASGLFVNIERVEFGRTRFAVEGWAFHEKHRILDQAIVLDGHEVVPFSKVLEISRPDVFRDYPQHEARECGFSLRGTYGFPLVEPTLRFLLEDHRVIDVPLSVKARGFFFDIRRFLLTVNRDVLRTGARLLVMGDIRGILKGVRTRAQLEPSLPELLVDFSDALQIIGPPIPHSRRSQTVDLIVPVYNGRRFLKSFFGSVLANTTPPFRLFVVDDCSTDEEVQAFLREMAQQQDDVVLIRNPKNLGFVRSVNVAAQQVQHDFVILTTDTEVPPGWLDRLISALQSAPNIATATPFSNAATICSFPEMNRDNESFASLPTDAIDAAFSRLRAAPIVLPSGVGFCMAIRYALWQELGGLDEETFGRGYGEENDWCLRAEARGFQNVLVPNLYVYHEHGGSFSTSEKQKLMEENLRKLLRRYPEYDSAVRGFSERDPAKTVRHAAALVLALSGAATHPALVVDHNLGGGANTFRRRLIDDLLAQGRSVFLVTNDTTGPGAEFRLELIYGKHRFLFSLPHLSTLASASFIGKISEIHCNNLVGYARPLQVLEDLTALKNQFGARLIFYLHDFHAVCPSFHLLDYTGKFCNIPDLAVCAVCLPSNRFAQPLAALSVPNWRASWAEFLGNADEIRCFSASSAGLLKKAHPMVQTTTVQPNSKSVSFSPARIQPRALRVGVVGGIGYPKGSEIVNELAKILLEREPFARVIVIGEMEQPVKLSNVLVHGKYQPEDLPSLIEKHSINMFFFPSIVPETFSYVLTEEMAFGLPIVGFDLGAQGERIRLYSQGRLVPEVSASLAAEAILRFFRELATSGPKVPDAEIVTG